MAFALGFAVLGYAGYVLPPHSAIFPIACAVPTCFVLMIAVLARQQRAWLTVAALFLGYFAVIPGFLAVNDAALLALGHQEQCTATDISFAGSGADSYLRWTVSCPDGTHRFTTSGDFSHPPAVTMVSAGRLLTAQPLFRLRDLGDWILGVPPVVLLACLLLADWLLPPRPRARAMWVG